MLVLPEKLVVFDLETTDSAAGPIEIIEVGAVVLNTDMSEVDSFSMLVRPSKLENVTEFITAITGLTKENLEDAEPWDQCWPLWTEFTHFNGLTLASWGSHFDMAVLRQQYDMCGLGFPHNGSGMCVKSMAFLMCGWFGFRPKRWKMASVAQRLEAKVVGPEHRALSDAKTAANVLRRIDELIDIHVGS